MVLTYECTWIASISVTASGVAGVGLIGLGVTRRALAEPVARGLAESA